MRDQVQKNLRARNQLIQKRPKSLIGLRALDALPNLHAAVFLQFTNHERWRSRYPKDHRCSYLLPNRLLRDTCHACAVRLHVESNGFRIGRQPISSETVRSFKEPTMEFPELPLPLRTHRCFGTTHCLGM